MLDSTNPESQKLAGSFPAQRKPSVAGSLFGPETRQVTTIIQTDKTNELGQPLGIRRAVRAEHRQYNAAMPKTVAPKAPHKPRSLL